MLYRDAYDPLIVYEVLAYDSRVMTIEPFRDEAMPSKLVMNKFKGGKLHSGSKKGPLVKKRKQALAIMLSEKAKEKAGKRP